MRVLKRVAIASGVLLVALQAIRPDRSNPPVDRMRTLETATHVEPKVAAILERACRDCHSHETNWPWYSEIAPVSWFVTGHVRDGRRHLNLSDWPSDSSRKAIHKLEEICREVEGGFMPISSYALVHWNARISKEDARAVCEWTVRERRRLHEAAATAVR